MKRNNHINAPWTLHFDRDGTEDFGIICDAEMNDLVASHLPCTRLAERTFGAGTFWLPEEERDEIPRRVRQMQVMTAAPELLIACRMVVKRWEKGDLAAAVRACQTAIDQADGRAS